MYVEGGRGERGAGEKARATRGKREASERASERARASKRGGERARGERASEQGASEREAWRPPGPARRARPRRCIVVPTPPAKGVGDEHAATRLYSKDAKGTQ